MKNLIGPALVLALVTGAAPVLAQGSAAGPAVPAASGPAAPSPGANSYTEGQARSRIEAQGYANVLDLRKDGNSIWRAQATKDGRTVSVALDYEGHVVAQ